MNNRILKVTRIVLIVAALLSIFFHIGFILELGVDIKYNVTWFSPEALDTYFRYLNLHFIFLLILVVYLICEFARDRKKSHPIHNNPDALKVNNEKTSPVVKSALQNQTDSGVPMVEAMTRDHVNEPIK